MEASGNTGSLSGDSSGLQPTDPSGNTPPPVLPDNPKTSPESNADAGPSPAKSVLLSTVPVEPSSISINDTSTQKTKKRPYVFTQKRKEALQRAQQKRQQNVIERKRAVKKALAEEKEKRRLRDIEYDSTSDSDDEYEYIRVPKRKKYAKKYKKQKRCKSARFKQESSSSDELPVAAATRVSAPPVVTEKQKVPLSSQPTSGGEKQDIHEKQVPKETYQQNHNKPPPAKRPLRHQNPRSLPLITSKSKLLSQRGVRTRPSVYLTPDGMGYL